MIAELFIRGLVAHLVADWFLQNEWMALNKVNPRHPAGYIHAAIHGLLVLLFGFPVATSIWLAVVHWLIDLRVGLAWWRRHTGQTTEGPMAIHVAIWQDQAAHLIALFIAAVAVVS